MNRIFNVMHKNFKNPGGTQLGVNSSNPEVDPQRNKLRKMLHKHFEMKQEESVLENQQHHQQENSSMLQGLTEFLHKYDDFATSNVDNKTMYFQPSCGETNQNCDQSDIENISKISHNSSEMYLEGIKPKPLNKIMEKYLSSENGLDKHKLEIIITLMQLYIMVRSKNPFNFQKMLSVYQ